MIFTHKTCGGTVFADLTKLVRVISTVVPGKTVMRVTSATVLQVTTTDKAITAEWYCADCKCNIPASEISTNCEHCGGSVDAESAIKSAEGGGVYCSECANKLIREGEAKVTLGRLIMKKVSLNPINMRS
jgi:hypothetical protein